MCDRVFTSFKYESAIMMFRLGAATHFFVVDRCVGESFFIHPYPLNTSKVAQPDRMLDSLSVYFIGTQEVLM